MCVYLKEENSFTVIVIVYHTYPRNIPHRYTSRLPAHRCMKVYAGEEGKGGAEYLLFQKNGCCWYLIKNSGQIWPRKSATFLCFSILFSFLLVIVVVFCNESLCNGEILLLNEIYINIYEFLKSKIKFYLNSLTPLPFASLYLTSPHLTSPHLTSPHLTSPHLTSPHLTSPHLTSPHLTSPHLTSPHLTSPHLTSPHLTSPHLTSPHLACFSQEDSSWFGYCFLVLLQLGGSPVASL